MMRKRIDKVITTLALALWALNSAKAAVSRGPCDDALTTAIPARAVSAPGGREFAAEVRGLGDDEREARIRQELIAGNVPDFLRRFVPVRLPLPDSATELREVIICAAPDYLAIGSNADFILMPMRLGTALSMASEYGFTLPTPRMVDAIYSQADVRFTPQPLPATNAMRSIAYSLRHNELVSAQRVALGVSLEQLVAGDKKDLVLTNRLWNNPDRVAIYGWHHPDGTPTQPLSTVHGWRYADYSHGARLISKFVFIDGAPRSIFSALQDPSLAGRLSGEGVVLNVTDLIDSLNARARSAIRAVLEKRDTRSP